MTRSLAGVVLLAGCLVAEAGAQDRRESPLTDYWPDGIRGAVSLTFDDGLSSQLVTAVPILDRHGLKGTFYVNAGPDPEWAEEEALWRAVGATGHELGNHGFGHPCSCNHTWIPRWRCLDNLSMADLQERLEITDAALDTLAPDQPVRSYAYPCYESWVGRGARRESYVPFVAETFVGGRAGMEMSNDPRWVDLPFTRSFEMRGQSVDEIVGLIEGGVRRGHWVVLTFHGVGDDYIQVDTEVFADLVAWLDEHRSTVWTGTFTEVAAYIQERQAAAN